MRRQPPLGREARAACGRMRCRLSLVYLAVYARVRMVHIHIGRRRATIAPRVDLPLRELTPEQWAAIAGLGR